MKGYLHIMISMLLFVLCALIESSSSVPCADGACQEDPRARVARDIDNDGLSRRSSKTVNVHLDCKLKKADNIQMSTSRPTGYHYTTKPAYTRTTLGVEPIYKTTPDDISDHDLIYHN